MADLSGKAMMTIDPKNPSMLQRWWPSVIRHEGGEISALWELDIESRYREDGAFISSVDLNYLDVHVQMHWLSDKRCSLICRAPEMKSWKSLHDAAYRSILAVDRYAGRLTAINGFDRSVWWIPVFSTYAAFDGPRKNDENDLMKAASANDVQKLGELLAHGAKIEAGDMIGTTAIYCAAESGAFSAFKMLMAKGANPQVVTSGGGTLLHAAAAGGNIEIISTLITIGLDINATAQSGHTPLGWAIMNRKGDAAAYLLQVGADPTAERGINLCEQARSRLGNEHAVTAALCGTH